MSADNDRIADAITDAAKLLEAAASMLEGEASRMRSIADYIGIGTYEPSIAQSITGDISLASSNLTLACNEATNIIYRVL